MGCPPPHYGASTHSISVLLGVCSKLPLPRHAEVQLHIPMTHNTDVRRPVWIYQKAAVRPRCRGSFRDGRSRYHAPWGREHKTVG